MFKPLLLSISVLSSSVSVYALDFAEAYQLALKNDTQWLSAEQEAQANMQDRRISRANLLPHISFNYRWNDNNSDGEVSRQGLSIKQNRQYESYYSALVLRQPLFNLSAIRQYNQSELTHQVAVLQLQKAKQQLAGRILDAYLAVIMRQDEIRLNKAYLDVLHLELERSQKLFKYGEASKTDQLEIQSRYQFAQVELINLEHQYLVEQQVLQSSLGLNMTEYPIHGLSPTAYRQFKKSAFTDKIEWSQWQQLMQNHNAELAISKLMYEISKLQIKRLQAEHYPVINAFAQKQISTSNTENSVGEKYDTDSLGIEVSFPIFSGGATSAAAQQARSRAEQTRFDMQTTQHQILNNLQREYLNLTTNQQRIDAYEYAVKQAETQIVATKYSMQGGERTNLDVLNAQQQYYQVAKDLSQANYAFLKSWLNIRLQAGVLNDNDIKSLSSCFQKESL